MSWVTSAAEVAGVAFTLGTEINEHKRANHLHREQIAQGLRIHEQEAQANKAYHRVEIRQANYQHARELLQSQLQHLEMIDLEKRVALRENMRDEWAQITDSAETVLIVNTLMLGVACAMLIEGDLPEFTATAHPWIPVLYYSLLSMSIWLLVASVRFAMVLRFRVGAIVVKEMRTSIVHGRNSDRAFHTSDTYIRSNMPLEVVPACDHPFSRIYTQPITRRPIQTEKASRVPGFINENGKANAQAGYMPFACPRRGNAASKYQSFSSDGEPDQTSIGKATTTAANSGSSSSAAAKHNHPNRTTSGPKSMRSNFPPTPRAKNAKDIFHARGAYQAEEAEQLLSANSNSDGNSSKSKAYDSYHSAGGSSRGSSPHRLERTNSPYRPDIEDRPREEGSRHSAYSNKFNQSHASGAFDIYNRPDFQLGPTKDPTAASGNVDIFHLPQRAPFPGHPINRTDTYSGGASASAKIMHLGNVHEPESEQSVHRATNIFVNRAGHEKPSTSVKRYPSDPFDAEKDNEMEFVEEEQPGLVAQYSNQSIGSYASSADSAWRGDGEKRKKKKTKRRRSWGSIFGAVSTAMRGDAEVAEVRSGVDFQDSREFQEKNVDDVPAVKAHPNPALRSLHAAYQEMLDSREEADKDLISHLDILRQTKCDPLSYVSRVFFLYGTITLLLTATIYAVSSTQSPLDADELPIGLSFVFEGNGPFYPQMPWAGWSFLTNILLGLFIHAISECANMQRFSICPTRCNRRRKKAKELQEGKGNSGKGSALSSSNSSTTSGYNYGGDFIDRFSPMMVMKLQLICMHLASLIYILAAGMNVTLDFVAKFMPLKHLVAISWPAFFSPARILPSASTCNDCILSVGGVDDLVSVNIVTETATRVSESSDGEAGANALLEEICKFGDLTADTASLDNESASTTGVFHGKTLQLVVKDGSNVSPAAFSEAMSDLQKNTIFKCDGDSTDGENTGTAKAWFGSDDASFIHGTTIDFVASDSADGKLEFSELVTWWIPNDVCYDCKVLDVSVGSSQLFVLVAPRTMVDHDVVSRPRQQMVLLVDASTGAIARSLNLPGRWHSIADVGNTVVLGSKYGALATFDL